MLLAAAPDLLKGLQTLVDTSYNIDHLGGGKQHMEAMQKARAAIAKATVK